MFGESCPLRRKTRMDPALLRERELFKKRALSTPAVEKRPAASESSSSSKKKKPKQDRESSGGSKHSADTSNGSFNLKALSGSSGYRFGVLAKIVNYMKTRHQRGDTHPLTLDEILDETKLLDIGMKQKQWLMSEVDHPLLLVTLPGVVNCFSFHSEPLMWKCYSTHRNTQCLYLISSPPQALGDQIIFVTRPDKKKILFYNDKHCQFVVDEEFQKLWRSIPVDSMDEEKIEEYLKKQGISSMQETGPKKMVSAHIAPACLAFKQALFLLQMPIQKRKKPGTQKKRRFKTHNDHLVGVLEDYSEGVSKK
ncbi:transcription initiation factor IIE subunit beta isoform X2 [Arapaima gigas]